MNPAAITAKINKIAKTYGAFSTSIVYKRVVSEAGGNSLIDRGVTQTVTDTLLTPQPLFSRPSMMPSTSMPTTSMRQDVLSGSNIETPADYEFLFTPAQMTFADVQNKNITIVLKDSGGNVVEQLQLVRPFPIVLNGTEIGVSALYRSVSR